MSADERVRIENTLRRIDELVTGLGHVADPAARESARALLDAVLDLHGLALARMMELVAKLEGGGAVLDRFGQDEQIRAVLLLYGLHPDDPETRIRRTLDTMKPRFAAAGILVRDVRVTATAVLLGLIGDPGRAGRLQQEIEEAIVNAVPDLDEVAIDWQEAIDAAEAAALTG